jgi:E3 ubiquitin-protein ligase DOA10
MEKEILKKDSSVNYFHLNIKNSINNKNNYNSKIIISILIFLIGFLLLSFLYHFYILKLRKN